MVIAITEPSQEARMPIWVQTRAPTAHPTAKEKATMTYRASLDHSWF